MKELVTISEIVDADKEAQVRAERAKELRLEATQMALLADLAEKDAAHFASYLLTRVNVVKQQILAGITIRPLEPEDIWPDILKEIFNSQTAPRGRGERE